MESNVLIVKVDELLVIENVIDKTLVLSKTPIDVTLILNHAERNSFHCPSVTSQGLESCSA